MRQALIGGLVGGLVVVVLFFAVVDRDQPPDVIYSDPPLVPYPTTQTYQYGQPLDTHETPNFLDYDESWSVQQDETNCTDPSNLFTCKIP